MVNLIVIELYIIKKLLRRVPVKNIIIFIIVLFFSASCASAPNRVAVPIEYGEVIFQINEKSSKQLYIIGLSHRDTLTRKNGNNTVKSEIEVYKIGEWLIKNEGPELLLPEGFFGTGEVLKNRALDMETLEKKLGNEDVYINAEILLKQSFSIIWRQVENKERYEAVVEKVRLLEKFRYNTFEAQYRYLGLNYLQERRSADMLQNIPEIIEEEYLAGMIKNRKAIFFIGASHLAGIIKYLKQGRIKISSPAFSSYNDYSSKVDLLEKGFGITIILPKILADDENFLKIVGLID